MPWITVEELKKHLNKTSGVDDDELSGFVAAACSAIEDVKGHVDTVDVTVTEWATQIGRRRWMIELVESPVAEVTSVTRDGTDIDEGDPGSGGWSLVDTVLRLPGAGQYEVEYTAGVSPVPGNYRLAALELAAHLWRGSQLNQSGGRVQLGGDQEMVMPGVASAMPYRVRELLGLYDEVLNAHVVIA